MEFRLLLAVAVSLVALGGILVGFSFGLRDMYSRTMDGLGLIEGGTPAHLDIETLYHVERLMSDISSKTDISRESIDRAPKVKSASWKATIAEISCFQGE